MQIDEPILDEVLFKRLREAIIAFQGSQTDLAQKVGCSQTFVSAVKNGERPPGKFWRRFCEVLDLDANTGLHLSKAPSYRYDWLRNIDLRQLGIKITSPKKHYRHKSGNSAVLLDQEPYTLTDSQFQVIVAMVEHRYPDAIQVIAEIMQGKREH